MFAGIRQQVGEIHGQGVIGWGGGGPPAPWGEAEGRGGRRRVLERHINTSKGPVSKSRPDSRCAPAALSLSRHSMLAADRALGADFQDADVAPPRQNPSVRLRAVISRPSCRACSER